MNGPPKVNKCEYVRVRIRGSEMLVFRKILRMYLMDDPNAFITSQFAYASVVYMFHTFNNHINRTHESALRIEYQDQNSTFDELLAKECSIKIHERTLQKLLIEIFKVKMKLSPEIMNEVFDIVESPYPLRFKSRNLRTVKYVTETATFVGSKIWSYMPCELKESTPLNEVRSKIKTLKSENCPYKLCKIYLQRIGYVKVTN